MMKMTALSKVTTSRLERRKAALLDELRQEVGDPRVLDAMTQVPRERFLPAELQHFAYENRPLPIGYGQTVSQPLIVALMIEALALKGDERVLEIGTGSGYQAALLGRLAREVVSVERIQPLAQRAAVVLADLGMTNAHVYVAGETLGWPPDAPYDAIIVSAGAPDVPLGLLNQLDVGGRMVIPVGSREIQELVQVFRTPQAIIRKRLGPCRFVPLVGPSAWSGYDPHQ